EDYTSTSHQGSRWDFYVNPNNSGSAKTVALKLDQDSSATFNGAATVTGALAASSTLAVASTSTFGGLMTQTNTGAAASIVLTRDTGAAVATNTTVAQLLFEGAVNGSHSLAVGATIVASSEAAYASGSNAPTQLKFTTTSATTSIVPRLVMDSAGTHHYGPTLTSGLVTDATAAILADGSFFCGAGLSYTSNQPTTANFAVSSAGHVTVEGVTSTGATGTGKFVFDNAPTF